LTYESLAVWDIHVAACVAAGAGTLGGLLDNLGRVELQALLAASLLGGRAGIERLLLAKVGAGVVVVVVVARVVRDSSRSRSGLAGLLGALEQRRQICQGLLDRLGLPSRIRRLLLVRLDLGLGDLIRPPLRRRRGIEHIEILVLRRREHAGVSSSRLCGLELLGLQPGVTALHQGLHDLMVAEF
jgi:hypothetical protein